jgi:DNA-binding winged helix-turn-helix (wHTH) protein
LKLAPVNDAVAVSADGFLTTADLAARPDFTLGLAAVSPSTRTVAGPGGTADVEPRVMQVLTVLADAAGQVVTRGTLFDRCWGGVFVGDDSLNRTIAAIRKIAAEIAGGSFEIETIPRTGYRLTGDVAGIVSAAENGGKTSAVSRRNLIAGGAGAAVLASAALWWSVRSREGERFDALIEKAESAIRTEDANKEILGSLEEAVAIRRGSARAWGLLAFFSAIMLQLADPKETEALSRRAENAARRAFAITPNEPNALLAMFELQGSTLDWFTRDRRLRQVIAIDPTRIWAIAELVLMLQAAGMNRESRYWNERAITLVPLSLDFLSKRALKLWIAGRVPEADKVIDQVRALFPTNDWAWWCRFLVFAMTGRAQAAQTMLRSNPKMLSAPAEVAMWRTALPALIEPSAEAISRTRQACFDAAKTDAQTYGQGVMILAQLGDVDGGYAITEGSLLSRGPIIRPEKPGTKDAMQNAIDRINMQWLFTPPCASMRRDPRFVPLCDEIGLTEYWRRRDVQPDYRLAER